jgi:hypothetical protein
VGRVGAVVSIALQIRDNKVNISTDSLICASFSYGCNQLPIPCALTQITKGKSPRGAKGRGSSPLGMRRLTNPHGTTCFMNASLQGLNTDDVLVQRLRARTWTENAGNAWRHSGGHVVSALTDVLDAFWASDQSELGLDGFRVRIRGACSVRQNRNRKHAHLFLFSDNRLTFVECKPSSGTMEITKRMLPASFKIFFRYSRTTSTLSSSPTR